MPFNQTIPPQTSNTTTNSSSSATSATASSSSHNGLSTGGIAAISVVIPVVVLAALAGFFWFWRKRKATRAQSEVEAAAAAREMKGTKELNTAAPKKELDARYLPNELAGGPTSRPPLELEWDWLRPFRFMLWSMLRAPRIEGVAMERFWFWFIFFWIWSVSCRKNFATNARICCWPRLDSFRSFHRFATTIQPARGKTKLWCSGSWVSIYLAGETIQFGKVIVFCRARRWVKWARFKQASARHYKLIHNTYTIMLHTFTLLGTNIRC